LDGKTVRKKRISKQNKFLIVPMDHGVTVGAVKGLEDMNEIVSKVSSHCSAVLFHKGIAMNLDTESLKGTGCIVHLSASTSFGLDGNEKVLVGSVFDALRLGADAVSVHVNVGGCDTEPDMLEDLGRIASECGDVGIPLLAMMYARGKNVADSLDAHIISHVARIGAELGADIVKCNYSGSPETFREVTTKCPVPVVIAGGPKVSTDRELLEMVAGCMEAGGRGISIGRNIFQHERPELITEALALIIFEKRSVDEALEVLE
jgi:predicted phospho-2-dehydro-3-deoxyheptonate aldolase